ncbi:unnamed protein product [Allacma fusca]|uniref:CRAL-TRIO domain-containing protein n=1 Tax=Allacma fusca TaxID=39272 RepID=A0A8J2PQM1_9HEXA|nr:unnamed protein product [Allacma fusca]
MHALLISIFLLSLSLAFAAISSQNVTKDHCGLLRANTTASVERKFVYQIFGYDYDNVPVTGMNWGRWDLLWLVKHPKELATLQKNFDDWIEELRQGLFFPRFRNSSEITDSYITIIDFDGLDLRQLFSEAVIKVLLQNFSKLQRVAGQLSYGYIINANHITEQFISMAKPFAGNFLERVEVYGTKPKNWIPKLLKKIPRNQLPPAYGGNVDFKPIVTCNFV